MLNDFAYTTDCIYYSPLSAEPEMTEVNTVDTQKVN